MNLKLEFSHIFTFFFTTMQSRCCHVEGLDNLMSYTVQYVLITSSWVKWSHSLESWQSFRRVMKRVCQAVLRLSGIRLIRELLAWASSVMDTLPLCLMNRATESSSSGVMEMNFPLSSITPASNIQYVIIQDTVVIYEDSWCHNDRYTIQSLYYKNYLYTHIFVFLSLLLQTLSVDHFFDFLLFHLLYFVAYA